MTNNLQHIAVIMDGNRRWAKQNNVTIAEGHREGSKRVKMTCELCIKHKIPYLTLYAFSKQNFLRPKSQVSDLFDLLRDYIDNYLSDFVDNNVKIKIIGNRDILDQDIIDRLNKVEQDSKDGTDLHLFVAINYSAQDEIKQAALMAGNFEDNLYTAGAPEPDLIIRTSGETRLSDFLLYQAAYSELIFIDTLWPDFTKEIFDNILKEYHKKNRKFGS